MPETPMVSCLMVALPVPQRVPRLKQSIEDYCRQTHPHRELVVVLDQGASDAKAAVKAHVGALGREDVRLFDPPHKLSLGALRNLSRESGLGDILCQWDDDDLHHPERVAQQLEALARLGADAVCLEEAMQFFPQTRTLYCTNWRATEAKGLPGTLLCKRSVPIRYPEAGPCAQLGEDTAVAQQLQQRARFHALAGAPHLYVYVSHGDNSWNRDHHAMLAEKLSVSKALLRRRESALREGLSPFDFGPGDITVKGYNGAAFTFSTENRSR